ncbi:MAG: hypothetical protein ACKOCK_10205, partial [Chloroflexota bacterium]
MEYDNDAPIERRASSFGDDAEAEGGSRGGRPQRPQRPSGNQPFADTFASIKVIGVGGGGGNAINRMVASGVAGIEFISVNTDAPALLTSEAPISVRIGDKLTKGLGAGGRPETGERAAEESAETLSEVVRGADRVYST